MMRSKARINFKNIIIWRHAEAALADITLGEDDMARALTDKGQRQAKRVARWLKQHMPKELSLLCSPATRALQTAEALNYNIHVCDALRPGASLQDVLSALADWDATNVLLVGHQPWVGQLVAHLAGFSDADISIKKGAVWWLRQSLEHTKLQAAQYSIIAVQAPNLL
jgi:phosphohistidine phosphatase